MSSSVDPLTSAELAGDIDRFLVAASLKRRLVDEVRLRGAIDVLTSSSGRLRDVLADRGLIDPSELESFSKRLSDIAASTPDPRERIQALARNAVNSIADQVQDAAVRGFLGLPEKTAREPDADAAVPTTKLLSPSQIVSATVRYVLRRVKAKGGLGEVWVGRDMTIDRNVAVKRIRPEVKSEDAYRRFVQEARITGQLQHPNIVPVYELGADRAEPFYVMRLVDGRTLSEEIADYHRRRQAGESDRIALTQLLDIVLKAAQAIAYAHEHGVLHRDLKPENIMVGRFGEVVVLDWGLAKLTHGGAEIDLSILSMAADADMNRSDSDSQTRAGAILGSPLYMAPEQAGGRLEQVDERTDVYGLGGILYESFTGVPPHPRDDQRTMHEHLAAIAREDVKPACSLVPDIPRRLDAIAAKALARKPEDRYPTAAALVNDLQRFLAGEPVSAVRDTVASKLARWSGRHRLSVMSLSTALFAVIVIVTIFATLDAQGRHFEVKHQISTLRQRLQEAGAQTSDSLHWIPANLSFLGEVLSKTFRGVEIGDGTSLPLNRRDDASGLFAAFVHSNPEYHELALIPAANLDKELFRVAVDPASNKAAIADNRSDHRYPRALLEAAIRAPDQPQFGDMEGVNQNGRRLILMTSAAAVKIDGKPAAIIVSRVVLSDYFFFSVVSLAKSDDSFAHLFDDDGQSLLFVSSAHQSQYANGESLRVLFPQLADELEEQADDGRQPIGSLYDEGILLAENIYFDPAHPKRSFTLVFGKANQDLYAPLRHIYKHVSGTAIIAMLGALAATLGLAWLLARGANRWN